MIQHNWTVLCSKSIIDEDTKNMSLIDVIEQIAIEGIPEDSSSERILPIQLEIVSIWSREDPEVPESGRIRIVLNDPTGQPVGSSESEIDLTEVRRHRIKTHIHGLKVTAQGIYTFRTDRWDQASNQWEPQTDNPLQIVFKPSGDE